MHYLALCCIVKDEEPFLKEWLAYHAALGVEHFYLYDNLSQKPLTEVLEDFCGPEQVTVRQIAGRGVQMDAYLDCLQQNGRDCHWLGFIDVDEFICPLDDDDLRLLLPEFSAQAGLVLSWDTFGSNGRLGRPRGLVLENYTRRFLPAGEDINLHVKSIVRPAQVLAARSPHFFHYRPGACAVNTQHIPVVGSAFSYLCHDLAKLNHYYFRSQEDFEQKIDRGNADRNNLQRSLDAFYEQAQKNTEEEKSITRFAPRVRQIVHEGRLPRAEIYVRQDLDLARILDLALNLVEAGKITAARVCLAQASQYHPQAPQIWLLLAALARSKGQLSRAEHLLRQAAVFGLDSALIGELARLRKSQGREDQSKIMDFCAHYLEHKRSKQTG